MKFKEFNKICSDFNEKLNKLDLYDGFLSINEITKLIDTEVQGIKKHEIEQMIANQNVSALRHYHVGYFPLEMLAYNRIETISDLFSFRNGIAMINKVRGIGEYSSDLLEEAYDEMFNDYCKKYQLILKKDKAYKVLLELLYKYESTLRHFNQINEYNESHSDLLSKGRMIWDQGSKLNNRMRFALTIRSKYSKSVLELMKSFSIDNHVNDYYDIKKMVNSDNIFGEFERHSAHFTSTLESLGYINSSVYELFSKQLTDQINEYDINLDGIKHTPRNYQLFASKFILVQKKVLIGDEMGLGKTIQALVAINHLYSVGKHKTVVICPTGLLINWRREINDWTDIPVYTFQNARTRFVVYQNWIKHGGILLTTYSLSSHLLDYPDFVVDNIIVDEAHYVKNPNAKRSMVAKSLADKADIVVLMTGTPLENNVMDMYNLVSLIDEGIKKRLLTGNKGISPYRFKEEIATIYLRRNIKEVLTELPDLIEENIWVSFNNEELESYKEHLISSHIMHLRQIGWKYKTKSNKYNAFKELIYRAKEDGSKVIVFSYFKDVLAMLHDSNEEYYGPITGDVRNSKRQPILDAFKEHQGHAVLLSQIETGGVGLNLPEANIVIICEPQFKPSTENQAIARAHRMGQNKNVMVYRLLTENSIDERLTSVLNRKTSDFNFYAKDSILTDGTDQLIEISDSQIKDILKEERQKYLREEDYKNQKEKSFINKCKYLELITKSYQEVVQILLAEHGSVGYNYYVETSYNKFLSGEINSLSPKSDPMTKKGLYRHHIAEYKYQNISNTEDIKRFNYDYSLQTKENLVYCDLVEHAILHYLISKETNGKYGKPGLDSFIIPIIVKWYSKEMPPKDSNFKFYHQAYLTASDANDIIEVLSI